MGESRGKVEVFQQGRAAALHLAQAGVEQSRRGRGESSGAGWLLVLCGSGKWALRDWVILRDTEAAKNMASTDSQKSHHLQRLVYSFRLHSGNAAFEIQQESEKSLQHSLTDVSFKDRKIRRGSSNEASALLTRDADKVLRHLGTLRP